MARTFNLGPPGEPATEVSEERNALSDSALVRPLLVRYELPQIDAAIRWLRLGEYIGETRWGLDGPWVHVLTEKGVRTLEAGGFAADERRLFYGQIRPYHVFLAHQFRNEDTELVNALRDDLLTPAGYTVVDGQAEGLEEFRDAILTKISASQFFLCLLTQRARLETGSFASSVWLYQEVGAAVALGRRPLLLVEDGMDPHHAGELQKTYEYIPFRREDYRLAFGSVLRRFEAHLNHVAIPVPRPSGASGAA